MSPYNPRGNGLAESAVKNVKHFLQKCSITRESAGKALYSWRNVPRSDGYSPAQLLFGRRQKLNLPVLDKKYNMYDISAAKQAKDASFSKSANYFDQNKVNVKPLCDGQNVVIQHPKTGKLDQSGVIVGMRPDKLSYSVKCEDGHLCIRARRMLREVLNEANIITPLALQHLLLLLLENAQNVQIKRRTSKAFPEHQTIPGKLQPHCGPVRRGCICAVQLGLIWIGSLFDPHHLRPPRLLVRLL